jgi:hypothetical protein
MFWKRNSNDQKGSKLSGPKAVPGLVQRYLAEHPIIDPGIVPFLMSVSREAENRANVNDIIIFDPSDAEARAIKVENFNTLKGHPELVMAEGWFDETSKKVELTSKKNIAKIKFFSYEEMLAQVENLKELGGSVFFLTNAGTGVGGPLGRGAALVRVNTPVEGKKFKKYSIYGVDIVDMQPSNKESKVFDSDKPAEIAKWISASHKPRFC